MMKIQPDISISNLNVTGKGAQKQLETVGIWLGLGPYRTDGIPLASTLLRSFPRVRHQLLVEFHLIEWDLTNLGVYYERENCPLATPQFNLTSCKKRIVECQESQREANPSRMPRMPEVKPYTPVTPPPELPADSGETHKQIHVGIGTVRHFDVESDSDYLFNCDVGSIGKVSDIRWYKRVHKRARVEVTKWNGHQSAKNQHWFHYQGRMHFHKTKLAFEGQYECGIGTRWIRFNVTFRRTGLGIGLFTAIGYATLVLLLICITVYLYRRMVRWVENDEKMDFDINTIERNEGNNKDEDHEEKDEKLR